jgi:hypothetical protein
VWLAVFLFTRGVFLACSFDAVAERIGLSCSF